MSGRQGWNGCELTARVRQRHGLPGVALTGFADAQQRRGRAAGFAAFLPRPADVAAIRAALAAIT